MRKSFILVVLVLVSASLCPPSGGLAPTAVSPTAGISETQCRACKSAQQLCGKFDCEYCTKDAQCQAEFGSSSVCRSKNDSTAETCGSNSTCLCVHKSLSDGFSFVDIGPALLMILGGAAAAGGGVGGGGVFVPVMILFAGFTTEQAIPLSTVMIGCASIANYFQLRLKKHPHAQKPLIDYNIALLMQPTSMGGTVLGVILNQVTPEWALLILLIALISLTIYRSGTKGLNMYKQETAKKEAAARALEAPSPPDSPKMVIELETMSGNTTPAIPMSPAPEIATPEIEWVPWKILAALVGILILVTIHSMIVGGKATKVSLVGIERCSSLYWVLFLALFPILGYVAYVAVKRAAHMHQQNVENGIELSEGEVEWTMKKAGLVSGGSVLAGIVASALGIGGGMVLGPIMLELGMPADVTAATSSFMILFTAWSSVVQYALAKRIVVDYALFLGIVGICSSILGQTVLDYMVKKHGRKSYIVFAAVFIISVSALLLTYSNGTTIYYKLQAGAYMGFKSFC